MRFLTLSRDDRLLAESLVGSFGLHDSIEALREVFRLGGEDARQIAEHFAAQIDEDQPVFVDLDLADPIDD